MGAGLALGVAACGHKGDPLPPLRPIPAAASDVSIERSGAKVTVSFIVPAANMDGTEPPAVQQVAVFAVSQPADAPPPTPAELTVPAHLVATVHVRPVDPDEPAPTAAAAAPPATGAAPAAGRAPAETRPAPGEHAAVVDVVTASTPATSVRYYAVVPAAGRRRGPTSPILRLLLSAPPALPSAVKIDYTERTLTISWQAPAGQRFAIDETDDTGGGARRRSPAWLTTPVFELPVQFGRARCFVVRAVDVAGAAATLGEPTTPVCVTPVDHFPPPAPTALQAVPVEGAVELVWTASTAADLAGYVIVRADEGSETGQRLTPQPVAATTYRDPTARPGATYRYVVLAVDTANPPNTSGPSNSQTVTARTPARPAGQER